MDCGCILLVFPCICEYGCTFHPVYRDISDTTAIGAGLRHAAKGSNASVGKAGPGFLLDPHCQFLNPLAYFKSQSASRSARAALRQYIIVVEGEKTAGRWTKEEIEALQKSIKAYGSKATLTLTMAMEISSNITKLSGRTPKAMMLKADALSKASGSESMNNINTASDDGDGENSDENSDGANVDTD